MNSFYLWASFWRMVSLLPARFAASRTFAKQTSKGPGRWHSLYGTGKSGKVGHTPTSNAARESINAQEDFMKMLSLGKLFVVGALLCTPIIASNAQAQHARSSRISSGSFVITCQPGFVLRCNSHGCFCVKP